MCKARMLAGGCGSTKFLMVQRENGNFSDQYSEPSAKSKESRMPFVAPGDLPVRSEPPLVLQLCSSMVSSPTLWASQAWPGAWAAGPCLRLPVEFSVDCCCFLMELSEATCKTGHSFLHPHHFRPLVLGLRHTGPWGAMEEKMVNSVPQSLAVQHEPMHRNIAHRSPSGPFLPESTSVLFIHRQRHSV